ncbi:17S U2 SnRNP complex component HTATSF1 [Parambassis ranga]|uniref:17S U2 SnRNP complex component HTATSF1 n=1 Tax=Parambassis ranga TaxID=210632 RepID=A0A6P7JIQ3_9TELE|nr:HIV Tat-specific factor 1 [Parambassis ranga]XP_028276829.1 HIV Tat-specific factor 1 [Parambassis ranga]XP_028276830.1 HIV Tat-specific factor 1 [Parambassis ranga]XP_028276832.1 HIV Tat-specific factor 1 [Parambassis ranga]XP_028276833.1 HIV Tat-specific factor 1 [Parambassis ranga]XP_028276834.1 HIV Tat-specific factor 1 [Parambassis ranga]
MSGESDSNKEFMEQLRMQELYGQRKDDGSDPHTYTDPEDGTVFDWDHDKKAWFPRITEDFMAAYQANYGFTQEGDSEAKNTAPRSSEPAAHKPENKPPEKEKPVDPTANPVPDQQETAAKEPKQKGEKRKAEPGWFDIDDSKNTNVYVSGLPPDVSTEEFVELMSKCGIVMRDPITEEYKVKLYKDKEGNLKGDGLCCYLKKESVALALRLIDESEVRGYRLHVEAARFELKGQYDASKKKKKSKDYRKRMQQQHKQLDWRPEKQGDARKRHEKVVIIRNMFHPSDFEEDPLILNEYREDLRTECEKFGEVKKVIIFDRHPDGVASVAFKEPEQADACIQSFNGRWFGGRQLSALIWDGLTDYQVEETTREREERLKGWSTFLEGGDKQQENNKPAESSTATEPSKPSGTTEPEQHPEAELQSSQQQEQEVDSTDSSLAGSDEEEA